MVYWKMFNRLLDKHWHYCWNDILIFSSTSMTVRW